MEMIYIYIYMIRYISFKKKKLDKGYASVQRSVRIFMHLFVCA